MPAAELIQRLIQRRRGLGGLVAHWSVGGLSLNAVYDANPFVTVGRRLRREPTHNREVRSSSLRIATRKPRQARGFCISCRLAL